MTIKRNAMGSGVSAAAARALVGGVNTTTAAAGTTHLDATLLPLDSHFWVTTGANNSGLILPPGNGSGDIMAAGDSCIIYNGTSNTLLLYPPLGGKINDGTATTGTLSMPTHTSTEAVSLDGTNFAVSGPTT